MERMKMNKSVGLISLGCSKNEVDSEHILGEFIQAGYDVAEENNLADVIIINTCGFIQKAKEESINTILSVTEQKKNHQKIIVAGCLSQRYKEDLEKEIPEADLFYGVYHPKEILKVLEQENEPVHLCTSPSIKRRFIHKQIHHAYLKISEGCNRKCGFCAIPGIRGLQKSRTIADIVKEAQELQSQGVQEISLIAQDLTYFGREKKNGETLEDLLRICIRETDIPWFRLMYAYPAFINDGLLSLIAEEKRICRYLDMPIQHCNSKMLKYMRRGYTEKQLRKLIQKIRNAVPDISLRTTVVTGHPGESEDHFNQLLDFIEEYRFERLGGFTYSEEEGTYSCEQLQASRVSEAVMQDRLDQIMDLQQHISLELNQSKINTVQKTIVDEITDQHGAFHYIGRTEADAPEIDNAVFIKGKGLKPGEFCNVRISDAWEFDLEGTL